MHLEYIECIKISCSINIAIMMSISIDSITSIIANLLFIII